MNLNTPSTGTIGTYTYTYHDPDSHLAKSTEYDIRVIWHPTHAEAVEGKTSKYLINPTKAIGDIDDIQLAILATIGKDHYYSNQVRIHIDAPYNSSTPTNAYLYPNNTTIVGTNLGGNSTQWVYQGYGTTYNANDTTI